MGCTFNYVMSHDQSRSREFIYFKRVKLKYSSFSKKKKLKYSRNYTLPNQNYPPNSNPKKKKKKLSS